VGDGVGDPADRINPGHQDTSMAAVPVQEAKQSRLAKRLMSPVSPLIMAATTGPAPKIRG
jgi:hypothetical protein